MTWPPRAAISWICAAALAVGCGGAAPQARSGPPPYVAFPSVKQAKRTTGELAGVVLGPDGVPEDGVVVAAIREGNDPEAPDPVLFVRTAKGGKFNLTGLLPGKYGLTAAARAHTSIFAANLRVVAGEPAPPLILRLGKGGAHLSGRVVDGEDKPFAEAVVRAVRESPYEGDQFFAPCEADGSFEIEVPRGRYFLVAESPGRSPLRWDVPEQGPFEPPLLRLAPFAPAPAVPILNTWVRKHGVSLATTSPQPTAEETQALRRITAGARVIAVGDPSYTGKEPLFVRSKILNALHGQTPFLLLAIEAPVAEARALDDYVLYGKGDLEQAVASLGYWHWDAVEFLDVLRALRAKNADKSRKTIVKIAGLDILHPQGAATALVNYLAIVDREALSDVEIFLTRFRAPDVAATYPKRPAPEQETTREALSDLLVTLEKHQKDYIQKAGHPAYFRAKRDTLLLRDAEEVFRFPERRGKKMAEQLASALGQLPKTARALVWAHNAEIARSGPPRTLGPWLAAEYEREYAAIGGYFFAGWIRAWDQTKAPTTERGTKSFRVGSPADKGLEGVFAAFDGDGFFADVRQAEGPLAAWLQTRLLVRNIGATWTGSPPMSRIAPAADLDALYFIRQLNATEPTPTGKRPPR